MGDRYPGALALSRAVLKTLRVLNVIYGVGIAGLLVASIVNPDFLFAALKIRRASGPDEVALGARTIMGIGIAGAFIGHWILTSLLRIVDTVRAGDPFVLENADRLQSIAWWVLAAELLHLSVGGVARWMSTAAQPIDLDLSYSFTPWIVVLLLFVLARVFDHGARMREDIEGTV